MVAAEPNGSGSGNAAPTGGEDDIRRRSEASQRRMTAFGSIVTVLMQSPVFRSYPLDDLRWLVAPAVAHGQYSVAQARTKSSGDVVPVAIVLWASVSDAVDARLTADIASQIRLAPEEWKSGPHLWVVEALGERGVVSAQIRRLRETDWRGHAVKIRIRGQDGKPAVRQLAPG